MKTTARAVLIGLAVLAILINVIQFRSIEQAADPRYAALGRLPSPDLQESLSESPAIADIYNLYFRLSEIAPASEIHVSKNSVFSVSSIRDNALGFGKADSVVVSKYNENADWVTSPDLLAQAGKYHLDGSGSVWLPHLGDTPWQIVTGSCSTSTATNQPTSFAVFQLRDAGDTSLLLIETCLAPAGLVVTN